MVASYCGLFCLKCLLYIFNTILSIMSIIIVGVGTAVLFLVDQVDSEGTKQTFDLTDLSTGGILIVVVGVLVILLVFCGCCGTFLGTGWMLIWFAVIMGCLLIAECVILGFAWRYSEPSKLEKVVSVTYSSLLDTVAKSNELTEGRVGAAAVINNFQDKLECCGDSGPNDYTKRRLNYETFCARQDKRGYYTRGCTRATVDFLQEHGHTVGGVVVGTMVFQLLAICLAIFLYISIA